MKNEVKEHKKFGKCCNCGDWTPRDFMLGVHVSAYDKANDEHKYKMRYCASCFDEDVAHMEDNGWTNDMKTAAELREMGFDVDEIFETKKRDSESLP